MTNNEFDTSLQKIASEEILPFDERNWELLKARLDEKPNRKALLLLFPFSIKQWAAAACLTLGLGAGIWHFSTNKTNEPIVAATETMQQKNIPQVNSTTTIDTNSTTAATPVIVSNQNAKPHTNPVHQQNTAAANTNTQPHTIPVPAPESNSNIALHTAPQNNRKQPNQPLPFHDYYEPKTEKRTSLAVNGGLVFQNRNNIAAGVTIRNRVSRTISIETNLRYMQGQQAIPFKNEKVTETPRIVTTDTGATITGEMDRHVET